MGTQVTWTEEFERGLYYTDAFKQRCAEASIRFAPWLKICEAQPPYQHLPDSDEEEEEVEGLLTPPTSVYGGCNTIHSSAFLDSLPIAQESFPTASYQSCPLKRPSPSPAPIPSRIERPDKGHEAERQRPFLQARKDRVVKRLIPTRTLTRRLHNFEFWELDGTGSQVVVMRRKPNIHCQPIVTQSPARP